MVGDATHRLEPTKVFFSQARGIYDMYPLQVDMLYSATRVTVGMMDRTKRFKPTRLKTWSPLNLNRQISALVSIIGCLLELPSSDKPAAFHAKNGR
jgi:hypothetical protein